MPGKYEFLLKSFGVMVNGDLSMNGVIEIERFMTPFRYIRSQLSFDEMIELARVGKFV